MINNSRQSKIGKKEKLSEQNEKTVNHKIKKLKLEESKSTDSVNSNTDNNKNKITTNPKILESFWKLSDYDSIKRLEGISEITDYFGTIDPLKNRESYNYIIMRLIKGLASNRKCSRLGYSCALIDLLNRYETLNFNFVFDLVNSHLKTKSLHTAPQSINHTNDNNNLTKEEIRQIQIGIAFVYLCWIQSDRIISSNQENMAIIKRVLIDLNKMRINEEFKSYTKQLYLQALICLIKKISNSETFRHVVLPVIEDDLKSIWQDLKAMNRDNFTILLACLNKFPLETKSFLQSNNLDIYLLISSNNYSLFFEILSQSTEYLPNLVPTCLELLEYIIANEVNIFRELWLLHIDAKFFSKREHEKKFLGYKLFIYCLNLVNKENVKVVFNEILLKSNNLFYNFVYSFTNKFHNLNQVSRDLSKELANVLALKKNLNMSMSFELIIKFIENSHNCHDLSDLINLLVINLNEIELSKYFNYLINDFLVNRSSYFLGKNEKDQHLINKYSDKTDNEDEKDEVNSNLDFLYSNQYWLINQISNLSKNQLIYKTDGLIKKVLTYLTVQSFFDYQSKSKNNMFGIKIIKNEKMETELSETLLEYVGVIFTKHELEQNLILIDLLDSVYDFIEQNEKEKLPEKTLISLNLCDKYLDKAANYKKLIFRVLVLLKNIYNSSNNLQSKKLKLDNIDDSHQIREILLNTDILDSFFIIISIECFRMFESYRNSKQVIDDIEICYEKYSNECNSKINTKDKISNEFEWIDVLVELLLNLFSINKNWIRNIAKNQFKKLIPLLTTKSVKLILDILETENDDDLLVEDDNEGISSEENFMNDDLKIKLKKTSEANSDEDLDRDDDFEELEDFKDEIEKEDDIDPELKNSIIQSLGNALATNSDNSDLDDEAMMKLDESIANAFKLKKKDKKHQINILQYKLRALDFIHELIKTNLRLDLVTYLIKPLLEILFESQNKPNLKYVSQRVLGFIQNLKNTKKINGAKLPPVDELLQLLTYIITCSTLHFNVINTLVESSMFCVRLIQYIAHQTTNETEKNEILNKLTGIYLEIINNKSTKINPVMYKEYLLRYPIHSMKLAIQLIDSISMVDVKIHKKTITLVTLYQCLNNQMFNGPDKSSSSEFFEKFFDFVYQTIEELMNNESPNIKFVDAFLNLVTRVLNLQKTLLKKKYLENLVVKLSSLVKDAKIKQAYKSRFSNLIIICNKYMKEND